MDELQLPKNYKYIAAFVAMRCNLNCSFCLNAFDKQFNRRGFKELSGEELIKGFNRIQSRPEVPISFSGGEPLLHKDIVYILNNLRPDTSIDILSNLSYDAGVQRLIEGVDPKRINRDAPYASIRASYHPQQMGDGKHLLDNVSKLQDRGFKVGIYSVLYPEPKTLEAITRMQFEAKKKGIDFRIKDYTGEFNNLLYGNYSKFPNSAFQNTEKSCECKTSELLIAPDGRVYRCHRDLFAEEGSIGSLLDPKFQIEDIYCYCQRYGKCHPCDVKVKTNYKQELGHTSVDIKLL